MEITALDCRIGFILTMIILMVSFAVIVHLDDKSRRRKSMVKVYGCSDDLIEIVNSKYDDEIYCYAHEAVITFIDGTVIRVGYGKGSAGIWKITIEKAGPAEKHLKVCNREREDFYSDLFEIDSEIVSHELVDMRK